MPKVSVIIPVYNTEKYLKKCLDSVVNQTLEDIEIICINDASTDNSLKILQDYAKNDKRIKVINLSENKGAGYAKNIGLKIVKGEYIGFVDPDDYIDLNYYEQLYKKAIIKNADLVKCNVIVVKTNNEKEHSNLNRLIKEKSKFYFSYEFTSAIYKFSLIINNHIIFPEDLIVGEDVIFLHKAVIKSHIIEIIDNINYYYIRRDSSLNTDIYDKNRMKSAIKTMEYRAQNYNRAFLDGDINQQIYLEEYLVNILSLLQYTITKTDKYELKFLCVEKAIELFRMCLFRNELDNIFTKRYDGILKYIKNNDTKNILNICIKYKNIQNFCMIEKLRENVKKDICHA